MQKLIVATLAFVVLALPTSAARCTWTTSTPTLGAGGVYVVTDLCQPGCLLSLWAYAETNHIAGLQRSDRTWDDTCGGMIDADSPLV